MTRITARPRKAPPLGRGDSLALDSRARAWIRLNRDQLLAYRTAAWSNAEECEAFLGRVEGVAPEDVLAMLKSLTDRALTGDAVLHRRRCAAFARLAGHVRDHALFPHYFNTLKFPDHEVRATIAPLMAQVTAVADHPQVCELLRSRDEELRSLGAGILKQVGGKTVLGLISSMMAERDFPGRREAIDPTRLPEGMDPGLKADTVFDAGGTSFPFGAHIAVVDLDVETGDTRLRRMVAVDDCGRILNPLLAEGQVHGGLTQGAAQALYEGVLYDEQGNPLTGSLMSYGMPSAAELISWETLHTETPTFLNPLGAKGIGESGTIGSTPAVQSAVVDAVAHLGVRHIDIPLTPDRVLAALAGGSL